MLIKLSDGKIFIDHQKRKNLKNEKLELYKTYKYSIPLRELIVDHIIPYCISADDSIDNLQLLTRYEHKKKTIRDIKFIKILRKENLIIKFSSYQMQLNASQEQIIKRFLELKESLK
jgi:CRISPR/Cas system Type II protein with McrA/HNH and RuvC-like nuclease domain